MVCRYTAETRSAAPATASSSTASHSEPASPDAATASPQQTTAATSATPWRCTRPIQPDSSPPVTAPIAIAANSQPTAPGPPKRVVATSGNSARGIANTIATMSTANDMSSTRCPAMYRSPPTTERSPTRARAAPPAPSRSGRAAGGSAGSRSAAYSATVNSTASMPYAAANPPSRAITTPASSGPATEPTLATVKLRVLAAGTSGAGISRGTIALRTGEVTANAPDCTATRARTNARLASPSRACTSSARVTAQVTEDEASSSIRRSTASATAPPHSPNTTSGPSATSPSIPTQNEEPVISYTCTGTATAVSQ